MHATSPKLKEYIHMNCITESIKKFQPFCHFTQSHILFIIKFFIVRVRNFCSKLHHRSMRMKITKNTLHQEKFTMELGISFV